MSIPSDFKLVTNPRMPRNFWEVRALICKTGIPPPWVKPQGRVNAITNFVDNEGNAPKTYYLRLYSILQVVKLWRLNNKRLLLLMEQIHWEASTSVGQDLDNQLPNNEYSNYFGPDYTLHYQPKPMANKKTPSDLEKIRKKRKWMAKLSHDDFKYKCDG
ncbi:hypothetical protein POM88_023508 [Heracleum sosnowskyi]|uniref:Uncharacterized protein n=1 Tax=Heracleum sosnowskyi TaxID=360622 RepID=A0AAD8MVZ7_9APIA|nr:hypothetical protein POM88_023508 [Heracleum sosnowskyi]